MRLPLVIFLLFSFALTHAQDTKASSTDELIRNLRSLSIENALKSLNQSVRARMQGNSVTFPNQKYASDLGREILENFQKLR